MDDGAQAAVVVGRITSVTVWPPGEKAQKFEEDQILAAGTQDGLTVLVLKNEDGTQTSFYGLPMKIHKAPPSGLVVPGRSPLRV